MNSGLANYDINDMGVGLTKQFEVIITDSMLNDFAKLSGDYNPLHMNDDYAKSTNFGKRICHGMLLVSFFSRLAGMYLPGERSLYLSQSVKFLSPCFIGNKITIEGKVTSTSPATRIITLQTTATNNIGKCLVTGEAKILVRK